MSLATLPKRVAESLLYSDRPSGLGKPFAGRHNRNEAGKRGRTDMQFRSRPEPARVVALALTAFVVVLAACGEDDPTVPTGIVVADFSLLDVNPNSPSLGDSISPRGSLGQISAWYFGHAT